VHNHAYLQILASYEYNYALARAPRVYLHSCMRITYTTRTQITNDSQVYAQRLENWAIFLENQITFLERREALSCTGTYRHTHTNVYCMHMQDDLSQVHSKSSTCIENQNPRAHTAEMLDLLLPSQSWQGFDAHFENKVRFRAP
jgi:hypothetical protein